MRKQYGNCIGGLIYLWCRGKIDEIVGISTGHWLLTTHYIALNKWGHALHFTYANEQQDCSPFLFYGQFKGVNKQRQERMLSKSGRKITVRTKVITPIMIKLLCIYCLLFPFVYLGWLIWPFYNMRHLWKN